MNLDDAVRHAWDRTMPAAETSITGMVAWIGGNRAAAEVLMHAGVLKTTTVKSAMRDVQRWQKAEAGVGGEIRKPSEAARAVLDAAAKREQATQSAADLRTDGLNFSWEGEWADPSGNQEPRAIKASISPNADGFEEMVQAMEHRHWSDAAAQFDALANDAYVPGGIFLGADSLDFA